MNSPMQRFVNDNKESIKNGNITVCDICIKMRVLPRSVTDFLNLNNIRYTYGNSGEIVVPRKRDILDYIYKHKSEIDNGDITIQSIALKFKTTIINVNKIYRSICKTHILKKSAYRSNRKKIIKNKQVEGDV